MGRRIPIETPTGPDIDLDTTDVRLPDGTRLTNQLAEAIATDAARRRRGRPTVTGAKEHTPNLTVRVAPDVRRALERIAQAQGRRLADVSRDALEEYARSHSSPS